MFKELPGDSVIVAAPLMYAVLFAGLMAFTDISAQAAASSIMPLVLLTILGRLLILFIRKRMVNR